MLLFDTHFHLPDGEFEIFDRAVADHLQCSAETLALSGHRFELKLLAAGGDYTESLRAQTYASQRENCNFACGVHPHQAADYLKNREDFSIFRSGKAPVAIGEIGLDYYYEESPVKEQLAVFEEFLDLALRWQLPAMLHIRDKENCFDAGYDALERLRSFTASGGSFVIHCCTIPVEKISSFLDLGAMIGVTGMISFKRADNIRTMLKKVPLERIFLETDSPYLAPVPFRGKTNTPGLLPLAAQALAAEYQVTLEELCRITTANAENFYLSSAME